MQLDPRAENAAVPVPEDFQPALETVIVMLPALTSTADKTLICPDDPAAKVAVLTPDVVK